MKKPLSATIILAWPPAVLSPNARPNRYVKAKAIKQARKDGYYSACESIDGSSSWWVEWTRAKHILLHLRIYPPDRRRYDDDNLIGRLKPYRDGIADALGVNDHIMRIATITWHDPTTPGRIAIELEAVT